jgi:hypothetical protein
MTDFQKGYAEEPRRKIRGLPRPGGDFVAPGKKNGRKEKYEGFPRPGGDFVAPGNKAVMSRTKPSI